MSSEDEFELNYVKIDGRNEIKLLGADDYAAEMSTFFSTVSVYDQEIMAKKVLKIIEKIIPDESLLLQYNKDISKKIMKLNSSNDNIYLNEAINRILSIDFKNQLIFSYTNIFDICCILASFFYENKYKINSIDDLKKRIKAIKFEKYDFIQIYFNQDNSKKKVNKKKGENSSDFNKSKSTYNSSIKDAKVNNNNIIFESEEISGHKNMEENIIEKNIKNNYILNNQNYYSKENVQKKILKKENFSYPNYNKSKSKDVKTSKKELPIELILLLYKLKEVTCLTFQIQYFEDNFKKLLIMILSNLDWLFIKGINEVKLDLGNREIEIGLDKAFEKRVESLYNKIDIFKKNIYYDGSYQARFVNCWEPEGDIFFEDKKHINEDYIYDTQKTKDCIINEDVYIYNIFNELGKPTNIKYIIPVNYSVKNNLINNNNLDIEKLKIENKESKIIFDEDYDEISTNIQQMSESLDIFDIENFENYVPQRSSLNSSETTTENESQNKEVFSYNSTPYMLKSFSEKYKTYFKMILIYCQYFTKNLKNIKKLSLYFQNSYSYEMYICFRTNLDSDLTHFLIFLNKIESLQEINFSFNCIDDKTFEYILGILFKNTNLNKLRLSFFTPDINYYDNTLYNLCSEKKISLTKLFDDFDKYLKKNSENKEKTISDFILEEKLFYSLGVNFINLSNLLKLQLLKNLEELVLRFDIPLPILRIQSYIILVIKFLINLLIMITFQQNKTHTVKILAPNLELNCIKMPYIRTFFKEISLTDEENNYEEIDIIEREKNKINKKTKLTNEIIENEIFSQIPQEKQDDYDINKNMENYDSSKGFKSFIDKSKTEKPIQRNMRKKFSVNTILGNNKTRRLNPNDSLQNIVLQMRIYYLPEIFNICKINNLKRLKSINLGYLDEITFKGFVNDYKQNCQQLKCLTSIKISLSDSVLFFDEIANYIREYFYINTPQLQEKFLLSNLVIEDENIMKELIELIYLRSNLPRVILTINNKNIELLSKLLSKFINEYNNKYSIIINSLVLVMNHPKYKKLNELGIPKMLPNFALISKDKKILCNENPYKEKET